MKEFDKVYHASPIQGLGEIKAKKGTHGKKWIYATKDPIISAMFLGRKGGDFVCSTGLSGSKVPYIVERFKGAFDLRYKNKKGSIYILPGSGFKENQTSWSAEVVSEKDEMKPLEENKINSVKDYLLSLSKENKLTIKYYPDRFSWVPEDDEDLVQKAISWTKQFGNEVLEDVKKYHPDLLDRVLEGIKG